MVKKRGMSKDTMDLLLENNIALQKTVTNLAFELKTLNKKVSSLLNLFEDASKSFKEIRTEEMALAPTVESEELSTKIDELVKQNRTIARGLLLLEKTVRESKTVIRAEKTKEGYKSKPLPEFTF